MLTISVVMGVYNGADTLPETIDSVLSQTDGDFEFIIVNDGSTYPRVADMLSEYASRDRRIRIIHKTNAGLTRALIDGCAAATGKYIARIDNGDVMLPERLAQQRTVLDMLPDAIMASCWTEFCGPQWEQLYTVKGDISANAKDYLADYALPSALEASLLNGPTSHTSVMFRRDVYDAVGGYRWQFYYGQDWDLWNRMLEIGPCVGVGPVLHKARILLDGISANHRKRQWEIGECANSAAACRVRGEPEDAWLEKAARIRPMDKPRWVYTRDSGEGAHFVGELLRRNGDQRCRRYFLLALKHNPLRFNTWVRYLQALSLGV